MGYKSSDSMKSVSIDIIDGATNGIVPHIGLFSGVAMITGFVIGAGIFGAPGPVLQNVGSVGLALGVWIMGGLLCGMGAFCYAELGTMWMQNGGDHVYLKHAFGMYASMCFSWTMALLSLPLCNSSIAAVFGEYVAKLALYDPSLPVSEQAIPSAWAVKITSMLIIVFAGFMNASSNRVGTLIQNVCTVAKLAALVLIAILGFISIGKYGAPNLTNVFENRVNPGATIGFVDFGKALLIALFPCSGFQNLNYVTGEVKNPRRTLPMAIAISVCIITCVYLFANIAYFAVLPLEVVATSKVVALELGVKMLGAPGAYIMCIFVALSALGAVNGTIIGNSRLLATAASEGILFPKTFAKLSPRQTPVNGIILSCVVAILLLIPDGGFEFLAPLYSFTNWTFYALTVGALIYLRRKSPNMERPFRVWTPLAYIFVILCVPIIALQCYEKEYSKFILALIPNVAAILFMVVPPAIIYFLRVKGRTINGVKY